MKQFGSRAAAWKAGGPVPLSRKFLKQEVPDSESLRTPF